MDVLSYFEAVRENYLNAFEATLAELRAEMPATHFDIEPMFRRPDAPDIPHRWDITLVAEAQENVVEVHPDSSDVPWQPVEWTRSGLTLTVERIAWDRCTVLVKPPLADESRRRVADWYMKWFDDTNTAGEPPFRGVVHQFRPYGSEQSEAILLDLGSAPPAALLELVDLLAACGARSGTLYTYD